MISPADFAPSLLPIAYQDEMVKLQVILVWYLLPDPVELQPNTCPVAWLNCPAGHRVPMAHVRLSALCVSSWKFSVLAGYQDICSIQKQFSYLQWIIVWSANKILFSMKAVFNKAERGLRCWFPENLEYKKISTSEKKKTPLLLLTSRTSWILSTLTKQRFELAFHHALKNIS